MKTLRSLFVLSGGMSLALFVLGALLGFGPKAQATCFFCKSHCHVTTRAGLCRASAKTGCNARAICLGYGCTNCKCSFAMFGVSCSCR